MEFEELKHRLHAATLEQNIIEKRIIGTQQLYEAAVLSENTDAQVQYRNELHALLDSMLDTTAAIITISIMLSKSY